MAGPKIPRALTIAGLDSGGGAGITADLKTFHALGVYGMVALTAVTAQNTLGVRAVQEVDPSVVEAQINAVAEDIGVDAAKTGMLSSSPIMEAVARAVKRWGFPLVVDPVMYAKSGDPLIRPEAMDTLKRVIIPLAKVVTPNAPEAERLAGFSIRSLDDARRAAKVIAEELHPEVVVVKGGHLGGGESIDIVYFRDSGEYRELKAPRINTKNTHGTGCSFSAAIAAGLAKGLDVWESLRVAKELITLAIKYSLPIGHGHGPVNPMAWIELKVIRAELADALNEAAKDISAMAPRLMEHLNEHSNIIYAAPQPYIGEYAAIKGGLMSVLTGRRGVEISFNEGHWAFDKLSELMSVNPDVRAALVVKYDESLVKAMAEAGYRVVEESSRPTEPPDAVKVTSRDSLMILGRDPSDALNKLKAIVKI